MGRKIRFPLKMKNGAEVRTLDELKENFDLESVLGYFTDGKLSTWLSDRYYDEKAEAVAALSADMPDLNAKLCEILEVEYEAEADETDVELIAMRREKIQIISGVTDNKEILDNIDLVAMDQDELFDILDESPEKVYLYGDKFEIPFGKKNISYIGINKPLVIIDKSKYSEDFEENGISFRNVEFEEGAFQTHYLAPAGEYKIEDGVLYKGKPDSNGVCVIPYGVTRIEDRAFEECNNLIRVFVPSSVTSIGECAFVSCENLTDVTIPNSITIIGDNAFEECNSLTNVYVNDDVIKENDNIQITNYKPQTYTYKDGKIVSTEGLGDNAFLYCESLKNVTIPKGIKIIGENAFEGCTSLTNITLPEGVTYIGDHTFDSCEFSTVNLPESVDYIGGHAFEGCENITNITIPESVDYIGENAFAGCTSLTDITIPKNVEEIGEEAFSGCSSLKIVIIQEGVERIGNLAFCDCTNLSKVIIPESVTEIGYFAFSRCDNLTDITLPDHFSEHDLKRPSPKFPDVTSYQFHKLNERLGKALKPDPIIKNIRKKGHMSNGSLIDKFKGLF